MPKIDRSFGWLFLVVAAAGLLWIAACAPTGASRRGAKEKSCLDCHAEYARQFGDGVVHQPVKEQKCGLCHRNHGVIGGVFLREETPALCFLCHRELATTLRALPTLHAPVREGKCQDCHAPHNAPNKGLLISEGKELCFKCHDRAPFQGAVVHQAVVSGCKTCHPAHGSAAPGLLTRPMAELCAGCHDPAHKTFVAKHGGYPVTSACLDCHAVHSSTHKGLLRTVVHQPVAEAACQECHQAPTAAAPFARSASGAALCYRCHVSEQSSFAGPGVHRPVAEGKCEQCHAPHVSDHRGMTGQPPETLCFSCHRFTYFGPGATQPGKGSAHTLAAKGDCLGCHQPHLAAAGQKKLLRAPAETLCLDCHATAIKTRAVNHPPAQEGQCLTCHRHHESPVAGVLVEEQKKLCAQCHQEVDRDMGQLSIHRPFADGQCSACHDPHGAAQPKLLTAQGAASCSKCHQKQETLRQQEGGHQPFKDGLCATCHRPHASEEPALLTERIGSLCINCHDDKKTRQLAAGPHGNCAVCHAPHGNDRSAYLLQGLPQLCLNCHKVDAYWDKGVGHLPAREGKCTACHDPHFVDAGRIMEAGWKSDLCARCHDVAPEKLKLSHKGIAPGPNSCHTCHDPHGGPDASLTYPVKHKPFADDTCTPCHQGGKP